MSRRRRVLLVLAAALAAAVAALWWSAPSLVVSMMTPKDPFDARTTPPVPDYKRDDAWLALPATKDEADVELYALPAWSGAQPPPADVFYVHSTSSVAPRWNAAVDDPAVRAASIHGGTLIQASVFNACCAVYAPEYRQASGVAFLHASKDGERAIDVAYADVVAAFFDFERRTGGARPFLVAGHSQGTFLLQRLVREVIAPNPALRARLVAAYLIGGPVDDASLGGLHACHAREETGCVVAYNARAPGYVQNTLEFAAGAGEEKRICVNPVLGSDDGARAPREQHGGVVFFDALDTPKLVPHALASQCSGGRLVVSELAELPKRDAASGILLAVMGGKNFHPIEYQLFYADLRADAGRRVASAVREREHADEIER